VRKPSRHRAIPVDHDGSRTEHLILLRQVRPRAQARATPLPKRSPGHLRRTALDTPVPEGCGPPRTGPSGGAPPGSCRQPGPTSKGALTPATPFTVDITVSGLSCLCPLFNRNSRRGSNSPRLPTPATRRDSTGRGHLRDAATVFHKQTGGVSASATIWRRDPAAPFAAGVREKEEPHAPCHARLL
jgi:hypothetical protein